MANKILKHSDLVKRIREKQAKAAQGDNVTDIKDPNEDGTKSIPTDPDAAPSKQNVPENEKNVDKGGKPGQLEVGEGTGETGTSVPSAKDGTKEDNAATNAGLSGIKNANLNKAASGLLNKIRSTLNKKASTETEPETNKDNKTEKNKQTDTSEKKAEENTSPEAIASEFEFTDEFHLKLASEILKTEEGRKFADGILRKSLGAEVASDLVKRAFELESEYQKELEYRRSAEYQAEMIYKNASEEEKKVIYKLAKSHSVARSKYETDLEKAAYDQGAMEAAALIDAENAGAIPEEGAEPSLEEIIAIIEQLVAEGAIDPATAEELIQVLSAEELAASVGDPAAEEAALMEEVPELGKVASVIEDLDNE